MPPVPPELYDASGDDHRLPPGAGVLIALGGSLLLWSAVLLVWLR
jgi:hypothetical protein